MLKELRTEKGTDQITFKPGRERAFFPLFSYLRDGGSLIIHVNQKFVETRPAQFFFALCYDFYYEHV